MTDDDREDETLIELCDRVAAGDEEYAEVTGEASLPSVQHEMFGVFRTVHAP